jgi:hypothetical protein
MKKGSISTRLLKFDYGMMTAGQTTPDWVYIRYWEILELERFNHC